jgi:M6 family metalloprotease-like protein
VIWGDPPPSSDLNTKPVFVVDDGRGPSEELLLDNQDAKPLGGPLALNGEQVVVEGTRVEEDQVRVESIELADAEKREPSLEAPQPVTGSQPWVTIGCRFADSTGVTPQPKSYFDGLTGTTEPGFDHFWRQLSFNNTNLTGSQVVAWYNLPQPRATYFDASGNANLDLLAQDCTAAADADVSFPNFNGINLMFNQNLDCCAWGGGATLTRDGQTRTYSMTWMPPWAFNNHFIVAHEMGHGFGLPHSSGPYNTPYDSDWDPMSDGGTCSPAHATYGCLGDHTISFHKDIQGWIPSSRKYVAASNSNQTITLERLGVPTTTSNYLMAQIPIAGSTTQFYTVEARRFAGYDNTGPIPGEAVVIHKVNTTLGDRLARVVDPDNNGNPNDASAMWLPGETFTDSANGISVEVTGSTTSGYTVRIQNGGTTAPPHDNFANAQSISGSTVNGQNVGATRESGEPDHLPATSGSLGENTVWYNWTAPSSGQVTMETCTSSFDTTLAAYTGSALSTLGQVGSDDDSCDTPNANGSRLSFNATAGTTYRIAVGGFNHSGAYSEGTFTLKVSGTIVPDTAPKVISTTPPATATGVAPGANITATFSEAMDASPTAIDGDPSTIDGTTFKLFKAGTTNLIPAVVTYDASAKKAILNPNANLQRGTRYKAAVTTGAEDLAGNQLDQDSSLSGLQQKGWSFKTRN